MNKELNGLLKSVLKDFDNFAKLKIEEKKKNNEVIKDKNGNIHLDFYDVEDFYNEEKDLSKPLKSNLRLEKLANLLQKDYNLLKLDDAYFVLAHILNSIFSYIFWDNDDIKVRYSVGSNSHLDFHGYINFVPVNEKPKEFKRVSLGFIKEIISKTFSDLNEKYNDNHLEFELEFNCSLFNSDEKIKIDDRLEIEVKNKILNIKGSYLGSVYEVSKYLDNDLYGIFSILEMEYVLVIKDLDKRIGSKTNVSIIKNKEIKFNYNQKTNIGKSSNILLQLKHFEDYIKRFNERKNGGISIVWFILLSKQFSNDNLRIIPNFFSSECFRFSRTEFFNYWSALEILLGNPEDNIKESLIKAYELFYPEERVLIDRKDDLQKTISRLWKIRNDVVHNGLMYVDSKDIWNLKVTVKDIFYKVLLSRMSHKFPFSINVNLK